MPQETATQPFEVVRYTQGDLANQREAVYGACHEVFAMIRKLYELVPGDLLDWFDKQCPDAKSYANRNLSLGQRGALYVARQKTSGRVLGMLGARIRLAEIRVAPPDFNPAHHVMDSPEAKAVGEEVITHLSDAVVHPNFRGQGVLNAMVNAAFTTLLKGLNTTTNEYRAVTAYLYRDKMIATALRHDFNSVGSRGDFIPDLQLVAKCIPRTAPLPQESPRLPEIAMVHDYRTPTVLKVT